MTVKEVFDFAMKNYEVGGDVVVECWEDSDIQDAIDDGATTERDWRDIFNLYYFTRLDVEKTIWQKEVEK